MSDIVQKLWGFCHNLRHDGIGYTEYVEQLTYLLFLKMADEKGLEMPDADFTPPGDEPKRKRDMRPCNWKTLSELSGVELLDGYTLILRTLGRHTGLLGDINSQSQSRFTKPTTLKQLIGRIDETQWTALGVDVKAHAYEGLLEKAVSEGKKGAGQLFTPRKLIDSIVACMKPDPRANSQFTICDPACGTGGFLVSAYEWLMSVTGDGGSLDRATAKQIKSKTYFGQDIGETPRRLALMNLVLHGLEPHIKIGDTIYEPHDGQRFDCILTNPPFGTKGANQAPDRDDFTVATSNKQLNFVQHVLTVLKDGGRAAVVLPDNCLFADQAGEVFKILTEDCRLHTVLRLPRGTFTPYSTGVKANVVFFSKGEPTDTVWIYDARTNVPGITKKDRPLTREHFAEFEFCYGDDPHGTKGPAGRGSRRASDSPPEKGWLGGYRWRKFSLKDIKDRDFKLDGFKWLKEESLDDADELPEPEELATDAIAELESAVEELNAILALLENGNSLKAVAEEVT